VLWDGISSISDVTDIPLLLVCHCLVCGNRVYRQKVRMTVGYERLWYYASLPLVLLWDLHSG
jgi:hypothetical protein